MLQVNIPTERREITIEKNEIGRLELVVDSGIALSEVSEDGFSS